MLGWRKRWALCSSTSASRSCTGIFRSTDRLVVRLVLPVPPFQLAKMMIMSTAFASAPRHGFAALRTFHLQAGDAALMGRFSPT
jgi:hypothetical protein